MVVMFTPEFRLPCTPYSMNIALESFLFYRLYHMDLPFIISKTSFKRIVKIKLYTDHKFHNIE